ncbi:flagellar biosynthesis protein FlhB [Fictibacillus iocasae]|uniref:Flagellar biosynthetic protein FlhB n=1 Tax=Fictibacillus iocasae TaxID=2715437 RepID=A0ABW2NS48_9BACL
MMRMNLQYFSQEKTEKATPKKRDDSRKKGQTAKSADVNTAVILFASVLVLAFSGSWMWTKMLDVLRERLAEGLLADISADSVPLLFSDLVYEAAAIAAPMLGAAFIAAMISNYIQVGFLFSTEAVQMKLERLDPIQGFKRIYSVRALVEMTKSMLKIGFVGAVTFYFLYDARAEMGRFALVDLGSALSAAADLAMKMLFAASIVLLFLSLLDYMYQKFDFEKNIRMSKQDIKDEYKKSEGDPKIKSKIKEKQRQMAMRRMMQDVPKADVIITNPTHFAIALKYDGSEMDAPFIVAKGMDLIALRIKEIAKENEVVMVENKPLARTLYSRAEIGDRIPEDLFKAVAEILAYVYSVKKKATAGK